MNWGRVWLRALRFGGLWRFMFNDGLRYWDEVIVEEIICTPSLREGVRGVGVWLRLLEFHKHCNLPWSTERRILHTEGSGIETSPCASASAAGFEGNTAHREVSMLISRGYQDISGSIVGANLRCGPPTFAMNATLHWVYILFSLGCTVVSTRSVAAQHCADLARSATLYHPVILRTPR